MEKKKIGLGTFVCMIIITIVVVVVMGMYIGRNKENNEEFNNSVVDNNSAVILSIGDYTVNEIKFDEAGVSNEECGITLLNNIEFYIYEGWGSMYSGKYKIENNKLICYVNEHSWDGGAGPGSEVVNITFTFEIIDKSTLKLYNIENRNNHNIYPEGLILGMTYSIK